MRISRVSWDRFSHLAWGIGFYWTPWFDAGDVCQRDLCLYFGPYMLEIIFEKEK